MKKKSITYITPRHRRYRKWPQPQAGLSVEPRAFEVDTLPSTPQLNAIMDRAMGKVKSMVNELEDEKGKIIQKFCVGWTFRTIQELMFKTS